MSDDDKRALQVDALVRQLYPQVMKGNQDTMKAIIDLANILGACMAVVLTQRPAMYADVKNHVIYIIDHMAVEVSTIAQDTAKRQ